MQDENEKLHAALKQQEEQPGLPLRIEGQRAGAQQSAAAAKK